MGLRMVLYGWSFSDRYIFRYIYIHSDIYIYIHPIFRYCEYLITGCHGPIKVMDSSYDLYM